MTASRTIRGYVVLKATDALPDDGTRIEAITNYLTRALYKDTTPPDPLPFKVIPSAQWKIAVEHADPLVDRKGDRLIISLEMAPEGDALFRKAFEDDRDRSIFLGFGVSLPLRAADHWCPRDAPVPIFGNREAARRLMRVACLATEGALGENVNVVVVDRGVDKDYIHALGGRFGGGWTRTGLPRPGATVGGHGSMIVRNILNLAPKSTIYDCPLLGSFDSHISDIPNSLDDANRAYTKMIDDITIQLRGRSPETSGPWIFENAWAVYDRRSEYHIGDYTDNPNHPFNLEVARAVTENIDVVFAAGNCGLFCPDPFCGPKDRGPGASILGANSHPDVMTASAVRTDTIWLGYSSQGPGQPNLDPIKPDFCAPSQFCEMNDAHATNTGTSAACALTAGLVAALRSKWDANAVSPQMLKDVLKSTARKTRTGPDWPSRLGQGILDAEAAYERLSKPVGP